MLKNGYLKEEDLIGTEHYRIANGDIQEGTKIIIRNLVIGNKTLYNVKASVVHTLSAPLLLGQSALQRFGKFSVDYSTNTLTLGEATTAHNTNVSSQINNNVDNKTKAQDTIAKKEEIASTEVGNTPKSCLDVTQTNTKLMNLRNI